MKKYLKIILMLILVTAFGVYISTTDKSQYSNQANEGYIEITLSQDSYFGDPVMLNEDTLIVGIYDGGDPKYPYHKDLYIFKKDESGWKKTQKISKNDIRSEVVESAPDNRTFTPDFNLAALHDGTLVVPEGYSEKMYLHFFEEQNNKWTHTKTESIHNIRSNTSDFHITQGHLKPISFFGDTLTLSFGDDFSRPYDTTRPDNIGSISSVLVFEKDATGWQKKYRIATHIDDPTDGPYTHIDVDPYEFGDATALSENLLAIGTPDVGQSRTGAVFLFEKEHSDLWKQVLEISKNDGGEGNLHIPIPEEMNRSNFGSAVALSKDGSVLVVGMPDYKDYTTDPIRSHGNNGLVYIFEKKEGAWEQTVKISHDSDDLRIPLDPEDRFGSSVALFESTLVIGAPGDGEVPASVFGGCEKMNRGAVYIFEKDIEGVWSQTLKITDARDKESVWGSLCHDSRDKKNT